MNTETDPTALQAQIVDLQSRLSHQEDSLYAMADQMAKQGQEIQHILQQFQRLQQRVEDISVLRDHSAAEKPPHY